MKEYSIPRRIWRIINPLLIYLGITVAVGLILGIILSVTLAAQTLLGGEVIDVVDVATEMQRITIEYAMPIMIVGNIAVLAAFVPMWLRARKRLETHKNLQPAINYGLTVGLFAGFNLLLVCLLAILDSAFDLMSYFPSYEGLNDIFTGGSFIIQLLSLAIAAPIVEELCFRGVLMERMRWMPVWASLLIQALMFGIAHLNLFQGSYAFVLGIILGLVYIKFRSIVLVIVGHASFNLASVLQSYLSEETSLLVILIPGLALTAVCAVFMIKRPPAYTEAGVGAIAGEGEFENINRPERDNDARY